MAADVRVLEDIKETGIQSCINRIKFQRDIYNPDLSEVSKGYFYLMPMQQNALLGVKQEESFLQELLLHLEKATRAASATDKQSGSAVLKELFFATAYFSPALSVYDAIFRVSSEKYTFLTSGKEANSFYGAPWPKGIVPFYYERLYHFMMKRAMKAQSTSEKLAFLRYLRPGWTFHAKEFSVQTDTEMLTTIGSSNFGGRSHTRDNELTCAVWTDSPHMMQAVHDSRQRMVTHAQQITEQEAKKAKGRKMLDWVLDLLKIF